MQRRRERRIAYAAIIAFGLVLIGISLWRFYDLSQVKADEVAYTPHVVPMQEDNSKNIQLAISLVAGFIVVVGLGIGAAKIISDRKKSSVPPRPELVQYIYDGWAHGFTSDQVFQQLTETGWSQADIVRAFESIYALAKK
jgi:hypothetical protein